MNLRMSVVIGVLMTVAALAAWAAALGLTACVAWAGEPPAPPAPSAAPAPTEVRVVRIATPHPAPAKPTPPVEARAPLPPMPDEVSARGWFGMQFTCSQCTIQPRTADAAPVWDFAEPPEVYRVEPGSPAARGGIQPGDVLLRIDGAALDSPDGGRRFGAVAPGQKVRWTVKRGPLTRVVMVTAGERPGPAVPRELMLAKVNEQLARVHELQDMVQMRRAVEQARVQLSQLQFERGFAKGLPRLSALQQPLRYEGTVGCSDVDVHGASGVNVTVSQEGDEIVITTCDAVVRVKAGDHR